MSDQLHKPGDWMKVFRRIRFDRARDGVRGATIKAVGYAFASYADFGDGTDIRPGTAKVAVDCEIDYRTAKRCIAILREIGLITLVRKAERRGHSDVYRLDIPEELLERMDIDVWDPARYDLEVARVREKHRGKYQPNPARADLRGTQGTADMMKNAGLRDTESTAEPPGTEDPAGHAGHRTTESAGHAGTNLRGTPCPPTNQSTHQGSNQPNGEDLSGEAAGPRARSHEDPISPPAEVIPIDAPGRSPCPHGKSSRRNKNGIPRCEDCRAAETTGPDPIAAAAQQLGPAKCEHGLQGGNRPDGQPNCPLCRRTRKANT